MDDQGMLSVEGVREISRKYLVDNSKEEKKSEKFTEACIGGKDFYENESKTIYQ